MFLSRNNCYSTLQYELLMMATTAIDYFYTWFLKESFLTGSSAARLMLLSRMKKRMRLVKMLWLTILWHRTLNLRNRQMEKNCETKWGNICIPYICSQELIEEVIEEEERLLTCWCGWRRRKRGPQAWEWPSPSAEYRRVAVVSDPPASRAHHHLHLLVEKRKRTRRRKESGNIRNSRRSSGWVGK